MPMGTVTISIDLELAWGNWDNLQNSHESRIAQVERPIISALLKIFERYNVPVTWAFVAGLLDRESSAKMPGSERIWYAPDVIETIVSSRVRHELGSHGGTHRYFDEMSEDEAKIDLEFAKSIHRSHELPFSSFVFPRNKVAKLEILESYGIKIYRGVDQAWHQRVRELSTELGRIAHLIDKFLPLTPQAVFPRKKDRLINLPGSMLFIGRDGVRRFISSKNMELKLNKGVTTAITQGRVFHLWFHPSNFWHETEKQLIIFENFIADVARLVEKRQIKVSPMGTHV